ncbi:MAG: cytochrome b/b6 domain-containing protein [Pseudomonadota bacterium]
MNDTTVSTEPAPAKVVYYRHRLPIRIVHWVNVLCLSILFMSGLGIFNAHPALYFGHSSYSSRPAVLTISSASTPQGPRGVLWVAGYQIDTTGFLGVSRKADGSPNLHAFPSWLTVPGSYSLADSRSWHFFFAWLLLFNGLFYVAYSAIGGHLRRDLLPSRADIAGIGKSIWDHVRFRHPTGDEARRYNVLQKFAYLVVIFIMLPLVILTGMAMSPALNSFMAGWVDLLGGRQSARTIHFIVVWLLVGFVLIHVFEVIVSGLFNHLRSMVTGYFAVDATPDKKGTQP